jgi:hypothetical protein
MNIACYFTVDQHMLNLEEGLIRLKEVRLEKHYIDYVVVKSFITEQERHGPVWMKRGVIW